MTPAQQQDISSLVLEFCKGSRTRSSKDIILDIVKSVGSLTPPEPKVEQDILGLLLNYRLSGIGLENTVNEIYSKLVTNVKPFASLFPAVRSSNLGSFGSSARAFNQPPGILTYFNLPSIDTTQDLEDILSYHIPYTGSIYYVDVTYKVASNCYYYEFSICDKSGTLILFGSKNSPDPGKTLSTQQVVLWLYSTLHQNYDKWKNYFYFDTISGKLVSV